MTTKPAQLAHAVLASVVDGSYPDSEHVAGAELTASALPEIVRYLQKARADIEEDICKVSRTNASELDSWITQAHRLHADIAASHTKADGILELAKAEEALEQELGDAVTQARFLEGEIRFNDELAGILGRLQLIGVTLVQVENDMRSDLGGAITVLIGVEDALGKMGEGKGEAIVVELMKERAVELRKELQDKVEGGWGELVKIDRQEASIKIRKDITGDLGSFSGESVVEALWALDLLNTKVDQLHQHIDTLFITPRLDMSNGLIPAFAVDGDTLRTIGRINSLSADRMFADLQLIFTFLNSSLPTRITGSLSRILIPSLTTRLRTNTLLQAVPSSLDELPELEALLKETRKFEDYLQKISWTEETELREWVDRAPKVWLAKKKEACLDKLRKIVARGTTETKVVERTETQKIEKHDWKNPVAAEDPWNEDWKEDDETPPAVTTEVATSLQIAMDGDEEEASGWGLDEDLDIEEDEPPKVEEPEKIEEEKKPTDEGLDDLDWGEWGEDVEEPSKPQTPVTADFTPSTSASEANSSSPHAKSPIATNVSPNSASKDVTLRENYTVTSIPDAVLEIIIQIINEATRLPTLPTSSITPAAPGLFSIPTLVLAAYRALAPIHYAADTASNMYLYNDCVRLSEELLHIDTPQGLIFTAETGDVASISWFGKRIYAREIATQRTILTDYLDGAQGFVGCTEYPQSLQCETAINSTIARLRQLYDSWVSVLSQSTLSQAIGSLLNTVVMRLINDIEDMSDIPEAESVKLAGFMEELGKLEILFPEGPRGISTTGVYCGHWIKFRFLQQVLESTMVDILYMFREGHLEGFSEEELCDLVRALFADSENRRKCIDEIRRGRV